MSLAAVRKALALRRMAERLREEKAEREERRRTAQVADARPAWRTIARAEQLPPEYAWRTWLICAGRGFGKTRTAAETVNEWARAEPIRIAIIGATAEDVRKIQVEGESGLCSLYPDIIYEPSKKQLLWPNGSVGLIYYGETPARLRGPQHHKGWLDELASYKYPQQTWDMYRYGLRLGDTPQTVVSTTPQPNPTIRKLVKAARDPDNLKVALSTGSTYDNKANLPDAFLDEVSAYEGTRLGRQELYGDLLEDVPGALWTLDMIRRVEHAPRHLAKVVVAVDPAVSNNEGSAEHGIVVVAVGDDGHGYVIADRSCHGSPNEWASRAVAAYRRFKADAIVAEVNNGGDLVEHTIHTVDPTARVKQVRATRGKFVRAEPVAALYERGRVFHVGIFPDLEDQMVHRAPGDSAGFDRYDALVWGFTELMVEAPPRNFSSYLS